MKTINIKIADSYLKNEVNKILFDEAGCAGFFDAVFINGITSKYSQGVPMSKGKIVSRIQDKIEKLKSSKEEELELEEAEFDFLKSIFLDEDTRFHISQVRLATAYANAIEEAKNIDDSDIPF